MQVARLFVTGTGTGVGKSYAARLLLERFARKGLRVGGCKPVETGVERVPADAALLLAESRRHNPAFEAYRPEDLCAYTFALPAAPYCADTEDRLSIPRSLEKIRELEAHCDLLIVEGAGGMMVPLLPDYFMIDLAREMEAELLLVTPSRLGCINETLLSLEALERRKLPHEWCVNLHEDAENFPRQTRPFYDRFFPDWWSLREGIDTYVERFLARNR